MTALDHARSHTRFMPFLFTVVGREPLGTRGGEDITVLTSLARIGIDPWQEAARLTTLPRAEAADSLAATFVHLPDTRWAAGDAARAARRLVNTLPHVESPACTPVGPWIFLSWRFWAAVGLVFALVGLNHVQNAVGMP